MQQQVGIILKSFFPQKHKIAVLDSELGKIMCVPKRERLCVGAVIEYSVIEQPAIYFMSNAQMIAVPFNLAGDDILFLHHVLELCYFFVPTGSCDAQLFYLLYALYNPRTWHNTPQFKKMFLCKLFMILGMYPEHERSNAPLLHKLGGLSVDMIAHESIDLESEQMLDSWLKKCIQMHPQVDYFKTVHFLTKNRAA